jgi:hypothetical protein
MRTRYEIRATADIADVHRVFRVLSARVHEMVVSARYFRWVPVDSA